MNPRGLYVHVPFCFHKCHYCDFYSIVDSGGRQARFVRRLIAELEAVADRLGPVGARALETIFVGGGTPTLLTPDEWEPLLAALARTPGPVAEFTVEANPETVTAELLRTLVAGGVNRLSIGAQSFEPRHLEMLERKHDPANVGRSVERARAAGIDNINLDLIFAVPGQSLAEWERDLDAALALEPTHLSCYALTYEPNTALTARLHAGRVERVEIDVEAAMYEATIDRLATAGYEHYEISAWTRPGRHCRHNLLYWTNAQWWPLGPGASGHAGGWRWRNLPRLGDYLDDAGSLPAIGDAERLDEDGRIGEMLMLGLRLLDGIDLGRLDDLLARGEQGGTRRAAIARHADAGLLVETVGRLRLTRRGLLLADSVIRDLI